MSSSRHLVSRQDNGGANSSCIDPDPQNTVTDRINLALNSSGPGYILKLCQGREYYIVAPILLFAPGQEISTEGYPIEQENGTDLRATLVVNGPVANGQGHTTAITGALLSFCQIGSARYVFSATLPPRIFRSRQLMTLGLFYLVQRRAMTVTTSKFVISECVVDLTLRASGLE
jgi:hypothetical protein